MTGAAGSGKSALQQTIAEICGRNKTLGSSFFFSATDSSRNTLKAVVPTIAYQLGSANVMLKRWITIAVENDRLIFSRSLKTQMSALIVQPFKRLKMDLGLGVNSLPYAILIDGLDECKGEERQAELLTVIKECFLESDLPFRVFIASRPEWAVRTALEPGGDLYGKVYHIQLSDDYDASEDIGRYLRRRFQLRGSRIGNSEWFTEDDIQALVRAASGQFIYAATVIKYILERRSSPVERLKIVLTWTPHENQSARPFKALDMLYTNILSAAREAYEEIDTHEERDFLLLLRAYQLNTGASLFWGAPRFPVHLLTALLGLEAQGELFILSDLRSLVTFDNEGDGKMRLRFYHKSFSEFMDQESRSQDLFCSASRVHAYISKCLLRGIVQCPLNYNSREY
jgi:hypothetical protein